MPDNQATLAAFTTHLLAAGRGAGTIRLRLGHLRTLATEYPDLLQVTFHDLEQFFADRRTSHAAQTRKGMRSSYRTFYSWAHAEGLIDVDPSFKLATVRVPTTIARIAPDDAVRHALEGATPTQRAILLLGRLGCLRRAEIASLHMRNRDRGLLRVTGKGEKQRIVPCPPELLAALLALEQSQDFGFYFPGTGVEGHLHVDTIYMTIRTLSGWNTHSLRHAGATAAYRSTKNIRAVQELLGHASSATTDRYLHTGEDELWAASMGTTFGGAA